jgi:acyl-CoA hydrolase
MPTAFNDADACAQAIIDRVGKTVKVATPLAAGNAVLVLNALYRKAQHDPEIQLEIYTALTLAKPRGRSLLEERFLAPLRERLFDDFPDPAYHVDRENEQLAKNVRIIEFYFPAGRQLNSRHSQENYICSNYTHVARHLLDAGLNVIIQLVAVADDEAGFSMSCNPDVSLDLVAAMRDRDDVAFVAQINRSLPFMYGDAVVDRATYHFILDNEACNYRVFAIPKQPVSDADHMIGLYGSALIRDGGELQIGIGALGDALVSSMLLRHQDNATYQALAHDCQMREKFGSVISRKGGLEPFEEGLFSATEMFVDSFMHLFEAGILRRRVYDHVILQRLLNERVVTEQITPDMVLHLLERQAIHPQLTAQDARFLHKFGIIRDSVAYDNGDLILEDGRRIQADFNQEACADQIFEHCLGDRLQQGALMHAAFFAGARAFYDWLNAMPKSQRELIHMKSVTKVNQLYGHEEIDRLHRKGARFVNTAMMMTLFGGAVSDGLADGRVVSGVGGQYNFVAMAHELPDGHSVLQLRSTRDSGGRVQSGIVFNYGHITIPRHLRDIVITEYGIAYLRGKTDAEVAAALIEVADSRFQDDLVRQSKRAGKLGADYVVPPPFRNNTPESIRQRLAPYKADGLFKRFPFGTDFTDEELVLGRALKALKKKAGSKRKLMQLLVQPLASESSDLQPYMRRMQLNAPRGLKERLYARLLRAELSNVLAELL